MNKNHCDLCGEGFDYPMKRIPVKRRDKMIESVDACELCAEEYDADAKPYTRGMSKVGKCQLENMQGCCCQCHWRLTDHSHPDTDGKSMSEKRGYICIAFTQMEAMDVAHSGWSEHGMCELFTALPVPGKRGLEDTEPGMPDTRDIFEYMTKELYQPTLVVPDADQALTYKQCTCMSESTGGSQTCPLHGWHHD